MCVAVLPEDLLIFLELFESGFVGEEATFTVCDGHFERAGGGGEGGERGIFGRGFEKDLFAAELERAISNQCPGEQTRFAKNLEAITDTEDQAALSGEVLESADDGAESGDGTTPQVISVAEATGYDHGIETVQGSVLVPDQIGVVAEGSDCVDAVLVAVGSWELKDGKAHGNGGCLADAWVGLRGGWGLFDNQLIVLNHGVAEETAACFVEFWAAFLGVGACEFDFEVFSDMNGPDTGVAEMFERVLYGFTLGIEHGAFGSDRDFSFHPEIGVGTANGCDLEDGMAGGEFKIPGQRGGAGRVSDGASRGVRRRRRRRFRR